MVHHKKTKRMPIMVVNYMYDLYASEPFSRDMAFCIWRQGKGISG